MSLTPRLDRLDKNLFINGNFDFWQRGTSSSTPNAYLADRWRTSAGLTSYTQQSGGATSRSRFFARIQGSGSLRLIQRIESNFIKQLASNKITLSFYAKTTSGTPDIRVDLFTPNSPDNYTSGTSGIDVSVGTLSVSWQRFEITIDVTANMKQNGLQIAIGNISAPASTVFDFSQVVVLEGELANIEFALAGRDYAEELRLCQRYYEKSYELDSAPGTNTGLGSYTAVMGTNSIANNHPYGSIVFKVTKRVRPSFLAYSIQGNPSRCNQVLGTELAAASCANSGNSIDYILFRNESGGTLTTDRNAVVFHWIADAEL